MAGNQPVILFRTHFLLNSLKNVIFSIRLFIFVYVLVCTLYTYAPVYALYLRNIISKQLWNRNSPYLLRSKAS